MYLMIQIRFLLLGIFFLFLTTRCTSQNIFNSHTTVVSNQTFQIWSGESLSELDPKHKESMDVSWTTMQKRRDLIEQFLKEKSYVAPKGTVVYPFSGIDLLNLFTFFPKSERYIMFGLEDPGFPFDWDSKKDSEKKVILHGISSLAEHLAGRNYFTYRKMKEETKRPALSGAYPVFVAFARRLGKTILDSKKEIITGEKESYFGFTLTLYDPATKQTQTLTYFKIFLTGKEGVPGDGLYEYFHGLGNKSIFTKSAEYLFHGERRQLFRNLLLKDTIQIVQDDSGFPLRLFPDTEWDKTLYGRYEKSWNLSGAVEPEYQDEMKKLNEQLNNEPLPFPFGYGVLGSKVKSQSLVLVLKKKKN